VLWEIVEVGEIFYLFERLVGGGVHGFIL